MRNLNAKWVISLIALLAFTVGFAAFSIIYEVWSARNLSDGVSRVFDALYATLSLFVLNGPQNVTETFSTAPLISWMLHFARFFAAASLLGAVWSTLQGLFHPWLEKRKLQNQKDHVIVMGSEEEAQAFIKTSISQGTAISVVVSSKENKQKLIDRFGSNIPIYIGEADELNTWQNVAAKYASKLVLASGDDRRNIAAQKTIKEIETHNNDNAPIRVFTQIKNNRLRQELIRQTNFFSAPEGIRCEPFSIAELAARQFFHQRDFFNTTWLLNHNRVHWLVFGFSQSTAIFLNQFLKVSPFPKLGKPKLTIVAPSHIAALKESLEILDACTEFVEVQHIEEDLSLNAITQKLIQDVNVEEISAILISDLGGKELELALELRGLAQRDNIWKAPIFLSELQDRQFDDAVFGKMSNSIHDEITQVADLDNICDLQFLSGAIDELAQYFHEYYLPEESKRKPSEKPSHQIWDKLDETYRNANRRATDHAKTKCEAMGVLNKLDPEYVAGFKETNIEQQLLDSLAIKEHDSWHIDRLVSGWKFNEDRNDFCRLHPNLVPFDKLDQPTKNYDIKQVDALVKLLTTENHKKSQMIQTKTIGLIGHNQISQATADKLQTRLKEEILPELENKYQKTKFVFLTPAAPGSDLVMAETVNEYFQDKDTFELRIVKSVDEKTLLTGYLNRATENTVWSSIHHDIPERNDPTLEEQIKFAIQYIENEKKIIDITTNKNNKARNPFILNAQYFASRPDILIAYLDPKKKTHGKAGVKETIRNAEKNNIEVIFV